MIESGANRGIKEAILVERIGKEMKKNILIVVACIFTVVLVWAFKYKENYNYLDSNATWHVLLTIQAYDETPASTHKFLPIVSLGDETDKGIQWAEMIADAEGNYYYTSFSPAGFALPYFFFKIVHLPTTEVSLYVFNTVLCCLSLLFTMKLFADLFKGKLRKEVVMIVTTLLFAFQTEIMHGMGMVYWHQSLTQVLLPLQFLCFLHYEDDKKWRIGYYVLAVIMPYVEWTGFISNVGVALGLFFKHGIKIQKQDFMRAFWTAVCTILALMLLCGHYLSVVDWGNFQQALQDRYHMRTTYAHATTFNLLWGYWKSFKTLWILLPILGISCVILNKGVKWILEWVSLLPMLFVMLFPVLENVVMKEHAISYTYDRMKLIYPLLLCVFWLLAAVPKEKEWFQRASIAIMAFMALFGIKSYLNNTEYLWPALYRTNNEVLAEYCREYYHEDSLYGLKNAAVRGYVNMLFDRGMYENISEDKLLELAEERDARYAVLVEVANEPAPANTWHMYAFSGVVVYDMETRTREQIRVVEGKIVVEE